MKIKKSSIKRVIDYPGIACGPASPLKIYELKKKAGCLLTDGYEWIKTSRTADEVIADFSGTVEENEIAMNKFYVNLNESVVLE